LLDFRPLDDAFSSVKTYDDLAVPMGTLAATAGMTHYAAIRVRGRSFMTLLQQVHNAPDSHAPRIKDLAYWRDSTLVQRLLRGSPPMSYGDGPTKEPPGDIPGFEYGVAASMLEPRGACVLVLGRTTPPVTEAEAMESHLAAMLAVARISECLQSLDHQPCALSARQLDCLRYAMAGQTATQTGRALGLSARTVEEYLERARHALGSPNTLAAAVQAIDLGWITPAEVYALMAA